MTIDEILKTNNISLIANFIKRDWTNIYFGAKPYLDAMTEIASIDDSYLEDNAKSIVLYFLSNARTYRSENALKIKLHLNKICK